MAETYTKTCFVISPIGAEGSETRKMADDFLDLLVEPAIQPFGFEVLRADKIASPSIITTDIIKYVQTSDLCIIDLTNHNPNVFYECGRRHENGRPFIQLIKKGDPLPFDVAGIRTISYDLTDPRSTLESVRAIQKFIKNISISGYGSSSTGDSLSSIADGITRIERTLNQLKTESNLIKEKRSGSSLNKDVLTKHPTTAFNEAFESGNIELAIKILPRMKKLLGLSNWIRAAILLAKAGETVGEGTLLEAFENHIGEMDCQLAEESFFGLKDYYYNRNMVMQNIISLRKIYDNMTQKLEFSNERKSVYLSHISTLYFQENDLEGAIRTALEALNYSRDAIALTNVAHIYYTMGRSEEAVSYVDEFIKLPNVNKESLKTALNIYNLLKRDKDVEIVTEKLMRSEI